MITREELLISPTEPVEPIATPEQVETLANAMAANTHQHAGVTPEDATPKQAKLPIPRPPLDHDKWNDDLDAQWVTVIALSRVLAHAKSQAKRAQADYDSADETFRQLWARYKQAREEERAYAESGEQLTLPNGAECAWEREHPGQICGVCASARSAIRAKEVADQLTADAERAEQFEPVEPDPSEES